MSWVTVFQSSSLAIGLLFAIWAVKFYHNNGFSYLWGAIGMQYRVA